MGERLLALAEHKVSKQKRNGDADRAEEHLAGIGGERVCEGVVEKFATEKQQQNAESEK